MSDIYRFILRSIYNIRMTRPLGMSLYAREALSRCGCCLIRLLVITWHVRHDVTPSAPSLHCIPFSRLFRVTTPTSKLKKVEGARMRGSERHMKKSLGSYPQKRDAVSSHVRNHFFLPLAIAPLLPFFATGLPFATPPLPPLAAGGSLGEEKRHTHEK